MRVASRFLLHGVMCLAIVGAARAEPGKPPPNVGKKVENVKVGDQVLFDKYSGSKLRIDDEECLILKEEDVLGVFTS